MKPMVYIAGPYRGDTSRNIGEARHWFEKFAELGVDCFCPHTHSAWFTIGGPDYWLPLDLRFLAICTHVGLLRGWEGSAGTLGEKEFAVAHHIEVWPVETLYEHFKTRKE